MKYFRTETSNYAEKYEITREEYQRVTGLQYPFGQISSSVSGAKSYYAVCPACMNPIQIVGLGVKSKIAPYGKHAGKTITDIAPWNYVKYTNCPFADPSVRIDPSAEYEKLEIDKNVVELYNLIRDNFDLVVLTIADALQIRAGASYWRKCLKVFQKDQEYCYPWLTDANIPYIFALLGMVYSQLFGMRFKDGSDICNALESIPDVILSAPDQDGFRKWEKSRKFTELQFRFLDHRRYASEGQELKESIRVCVDEIKGGKAHTRYDHVLEFSESSFEQRRKYVQKRQQWLLDIAKQEMPDIKPNV